MKQTLLRSALLLAMSVWAMTLAGCSTDESKLYDIFKCGKAASLLGRTAEASAAGRKSVEYDSRIQGSKARLAMEMSEKFNDQTGMNGRNRSAAADAVRDLYQSSTCQAIYR